MTSYRPRDWVVRNAVSVGSQEAATAAVIRPESNVTGRMDPSPPNINLNSGEGAGPGSTSDMNAPLIQAFNPPTMQTLPQGVLVGVSTSNVPGLGATSQHAGLPYDNSLRMQPPQTFPGLVAAQMKQFIEQPGPAQGNHERMDQWSGMITWWGTDTTRNETRELRAQVTATASKGDPCAIFLMEFPFFEDSYPRTRLDWHQHGRTSCYLHLVGQQCQ